MLASLYISPLESCNLACKSCYTKKTKNVLTNRQILGFVKRYRSYLTSKNQDLRSIIFCGGEVFLLSAFPRLVNNLLKKKIFITIITNGTIDRLDEINDPKNCQLLVSLDGPKEVHDQNRGAGNFDKSINFINHARKLGFPVGIFFLITKDSYKHKNSFPKLLDLPITYLTDRLGSLTPAQVLDIKRNYPTFPGKNFGCSQISLQSSGLIYGCCESPTLLAKISDPIKKVVDNFLKSLTTCQKCELFNKNNNLEIGNWKLEISCSGCCDPQYNCGYSQELHLPSCQSVIKLFA